MSIFQDDLSTVSGHSVFETCVIPILFYGCENWCLTERCLLLLECFIGELSKRLLRLPKWYSNTPATIICDLKSACCFCTCRKLYFQQKMVSNDGKCTISSKMFNAVSDDATSLCMIRECRELEKLFNPDFPSAVVDDKTPNPIQKRGRRRFSRGIASLGLGNMKYEMT